MSSEHTSPSNSSVSLPTTATTNSRRPVTTRAMSVRSQPPKDNVIVKHSLIAGSLSGMASTILLYPMDVIRTKLQAMSSSRQPQLGPMATMRHTLRHGGVKAFYTGMTLPLAAQGVYKGTVFTVNNVTETILIDWKTRQNQRHGRVLGKGHYLTMTDRFISGFVGGAVNAVLFVTPVELVRNQLIAQHSKLADGISLEKQKTSLDVIRSSIRSHGLGSLWRGASWSVARDGLGCGCFFLTMAWMQRYLTRPGEKPSMSTTVLSGGAAGLAFWVVALPMDTVKTWIQSSELTVTVSAADRVQRILQTEGRAAVVQNLFRGWQVAYGRGIPAAAVTITVYSQMYRYLEGEATK